MHLRRDLAKPIITAVSLVLVIGFVTVYILPQYVYISPFSTVYVNGIVDHKTIGYGTDGGAPFTNYIMNVNLFGDDPVNNVKSGNTLGYIVSETDWNLVEWGDTVKIEVLPNAKAEIMNLYPAAKPASWHETYEDWLKIDFTSDKSTYSPTETVNFTVNLKNIQPPGQSRGFNLSILKTFSFWAYGLGGNQIYSSANSMVSVQKVTLSPNQTINYSFQWPLNGISPGYYSIRVFIGYIGDREEACLTGTQVILIR